MQGTRERILDVIIRRREVRVEELASEFDITTAAVRRHLDNLRADGLIDARSVKQATGRPYYSYFPTDKAVEQAASAYVDLLGRMLISLGGRTDVLSTVMSSVAEAVASKHRRDDENDDQEARVVHVTESLREEGILDSWHAAHDGYHLVNGACPYRKVAEMSSLPCEADRKAIELLLGTDVQQIHRIVDGASCCEYVVAVPQILEEHEVG